MNKKTILTNLVTFAILFLALNLAKDYFFPATPENLTTKGQIVLTSQKNAFQIGDLVLADIQNNSTETVMIQNKCPQEPLEVLHFINEEWSQKPNVTATISCKDSKNIELKPGEKHTIPFTSWNHAFFGEIGKYKLRTNVILKSSGTNIPLQKRETQTITTETQLLAQTQKNTTQAIQTIKNAIEEVLPIGNVNPENIKILESNEFEIQPQGWFSYLWTSIFYQPLYNVLIFLIQIAPGKDLGMAIILLTIIIRTVLLIPSQNALKSQRKMQELQPKLNKIKEKYKDNQEMMAKETMAVWKENKANPLGSCLPLLIQFPVLIALFYVIQDGLNPDKSYLLYSFLKSFSFENINVIFLNILDLTKINFFILPLIVGGLQFLQMKLATIKNKHDPTDNKPAKKKVKSEMEIATGTMMYIMPVMIAIFTSQAPAGVGLYWSVSTIYGIGQQLVINHKSKKDTTKIKVLP